MKNHIIALAAAALVLPGCSPPPLTHLAPTATAHRETVGANEMMDVVDAMYAWARTVARPGPIGVESPLAVFGTDLATPAATHEAYMRIGNNFGMVDADPRKDCHMEETSGTALKLPQTVWRCTLSNVGSNIHFTNLVRRGNLVGVDLWVESNGAIDVNNSEYCALLRRSSSGEWSVVRSRGAGDGCHGDYEP